MKYISIVSLLEFTKAGRWNFGAFWNFWDCRLFFFGLYVLNGLLLGGEGLILLYQLDDFLEGFAFRGSPFGIFHKFLLLSRKPVDETFLLRAVFR